MKPSTLIALGILFVAALGLAALCTSGLSKKPKARHPHVSAKPPAPVTAPLPHGRGRLALAALGQAEGWDLENGKLAGAEGADLLPLPAPGVEGIAALGGANGARLAHAEESAGALEAPAEGYAVTADLGAGASAFFVRTRSGRYARIRLLKGYTPESLDFEWVFQPDGTRVLGGGKR